MRNGEITGYKDYIVLTASNPQTLAAYVNDKLKDGYFPIGGVSPSGGSYIQAVAKPIRHSRAYMGPG